MKFALTLFIALCTSQAYGMRIPATLSNGLYVSTEGFELHPQSTSWVRATAPFELKNKIEALFRIKGSDSSSNTTFTIRVDKDTPHKTLKEYSTKWLKSYGQFGLEVLGHQYFRNSNDADGFVIDISNTTSKKKLRQVIFFRNSKAVILTCMDQDVNFKSAIKNCNDLVKTFSWQEASLKNPESLIQ